MQVNFSKFLNQSFDKGMQRGVETEKTKTVIKTNKLKVQILKVRGGLKEVINIMIFYWQCLLLRYQLPIVTAILTPEKK